MIESPAGAEVTVWMAAVKLAVTLLGAAMVTFCGVVTPVMSPLNPEN
jgi:hypothetical protein